LAKHDPLTRRDLTWAAAATLVIFAFFVITLRQDVGGTEDSPKFQFIGQALGTAHSPGYPFYVMATWLFTRVDLGTLAYRVNLFSAVCGALACLCIFLTARRLNVTRPLSLAAALGAATSYPVWSNSVTAEVYTLAAVLSGMAVYWLIAFAQTHRLWQLYAACAAWACGFGNHLTIVGILPAAVIYGVIKDRAVLRPRVAITAAIIGLIGVAQYWFIAVRTMQGAPYLEARATTIMGVFDVIIARDVSWARFYQAQSAVAAIEVPMLLNGIRVNMGTIPVVLVVIAIGIGIWKKNAEILLILGAAAGTLGMIANLWGDVVGFITPVCVQLWPLAAFGLQFLVTRASANPTFAKATAGRPSALAVAGMVAMILPATNFISNRPRIELLRTPGEGPGVRALYSQLPMRSAIVAENYWLARLVNYMHFSGEVDPDPNPRVLDNDANEVRTAVADGLEVYAFEGATHWLNAQGLRFERTTVARQPFGPWLAAQPRGTLFVAAAAGRALPFEWLPAGNRSQRPANYSVLTWSLGEGDAVVEQHDAGVTTTRAVGSTGNPVTITSNDDGPRMVWGDDVLLAIDRGLIVMAFTPEGHVAGRWAFAIDEPPGMELPPTPYVLRREVTCETLRLGQPTDVTGVLADGAWLATLDGFGKAEIAIETAAPPSEWRHYLSHGRGDGAIEVNGGRLLLDATRGTRPVFRFRLPPQPARAVATLYSGDVSSARVCPDAVPALPPTGALEAAGEGDGLFGAGWHLGERAATQRFRWSQRSSMLTWRMAAPASVRMLLRLRAANAKGATIQASVNGTAVASCALTAGEWTDCRLDLPASAVHTGINQLMLTSDTVSPTADRPGDPRELAFVLQASRIRVGQ
jgi:hypothetical protein